MHESLKPYLDLVEAGYLNKQVSGDLILFNYTDLCTYEKHWNEYTLNARGIIFNSITGECVARPFSKFFNLSELENKTLPQPPLDESYEVFNKEDGSMGVLYLDPADNTFKISTRGSFTSPQALKATEMLHHCQDDGMSAEFVWHFSHDANDWTLLFEIIYPENRLNPGARLVTDYGTTETLILLAAINIKTGKDMPREELEIVAEQLGLPVVKKFEYNLEQIIAMQETLPATEEGFVVKFESGFRVKVKGKEYCRLHRILNGINPLAIWEVMSATEDFILPESYLINIPEEILPEVEEIQAKLQDRAVDVVNEIQNDYLRFQALPHPEINIKKSLGLFCQDPSNKVRHPSCMFAMHDGNDKLLAKLVTKMIRPKANVI